jgi:DNA-binding transcriptional LysR family regulator
MRGDSLDDLAAFAAVGHARSFTRAAAKLGVSQSAGDLETNVYRLR